jgi:hypothetical protein
VLSSRGMLPYRLVTSREPKIQLDCSSLFLTEFTKSEEISTVTTRLVNNGYSKEQITNVTSRINRTPRDKPEYTTFVKIPFRSESQRHQIMQLCKRTGMAEKIRIIFTTERSLAWQFRPPHEKPACPVNCIACQTAERPATCFTKNVVYKVACSLCNAVYVGQTERTIRSRIQEHTKSSNSHVYQHMAAHSPASSTSFRWRILATHPHTNTRLAMEALHIKAASNLMNGCEGAPILPYLQWNFILVSCRPNLFSYSHTHTHTLPIIFTLDPAFFSWIFSLSLSLSLSITHTHTLSLFLCLFLNIHSLSHTRTHRETGYISKRVLLHKQQFCILTKTAKRLFNKLLIYWQRCRYTLTGFINYHYQKPVWPTLHNLC